MSVVFADTSYYVALLLKADSRHMRAGELTNGYRGQIVSTAWVILELGNYLSAVPNRKLFVDFAADLQLDPDVLIIPAGSKNFDAGLKLYAERLDKSWSLVDCLSFLTMREHGITDAWTADHHFAQAGFKALLI